MTASHRVLRRPLLIWACPASTALAMVLSAAACGGDDDDTAPVATRPASASSPTSSTPVVGVADNTFSPSTLTVKAGTKVTWTWEGKNPHSVVGKEKVDGRDVKSEPLTGAGTFEFTFAKAGTFDYLCGVHGEAMSGKIIVQ